MPLNLNDEKLKELLLKENYINKDDLAKAAEFATNHHTSFVEHLLNQGLITRDLVGQAIAESYGIPYADLNSLEPKSSQILKIPEKTAKKYRIVLFEEKNNNVVIATDNPEQKKLKQIIEELFPKQKFNIAFSLPEDIEAVFVHYQKPLNTRFNKILKSESRIAPELIQEILEDALIYKTSDIHLEPQETDVLIRFRIDGILHEAGRLPSEYYENILNRIKVLSNLRIDEHFSSQDGAIRYIPKKGRDAVDLRVSIIPTLNGEKVAIRILSHYIKNFTLGDLGFLPKDQEEVLRASQKPFGMILVTGPTGSGKTTTLYAVLKNENRPTINITTIEDPVEYKINGVNQIQVNAGTNLTFAKGLRSIVRQDPNIILVGEIRDQETAEIAVNAALTGHLLLSTFHANDAATAIPRLLDMGVEPFLVASTLQLIIAQRLVRKICENCRYSYEAKQETFEQYFKEAPLFFRDKTTTVYRGKGCEACNHIGYKDRIAIFELIEIGKEMQDLILKNPSTKQIWDLAKTQNAHTLFEDGVEKVKAGITTLEELLRVASPQT